MFKYDVVAATTHRRQENFWKFKRKCNYQLWRRRKIFNRNESSPVERVILKLQSDNLVVDKVGGLQPSLDKNY